MAPYAIPYQAGPGEKRTATNRPKWDSLEARGALAKQSTTIKELASTTSRHITGGHTFPVVSFLSTGPSSPPLFIVAATGRYPLSNLQIRIVDIDLLHEENLWTWDALAKTEHNTVVQYLLGGHVSYLFPFTATPDVNTKRFNIFMDAPNGRFTELFRLKRLNNIWRTAEIVEASFTDGKHGIVWRTFANDLPKEMATDWTDMEKFEILDVAKLDNIKLSNGARFQILQSVPK